MRKQRTHENGKVSFYHPLVAFLSFYLLAFCSNLLAFYLPAFVECLLFVSFFSRRGGKEESSIDVSYLVPSTQISHIID
jgi:hypothetical protein